MSDELSLGPIELVAIMAACLRAGKGGTQAKAWGDAIAEAMFGLSAILANEARIREQLTAVVQQAEEPPLVEPVPAIVVP